MLQTYFILYLSLPFPQDSWDRFAAASKYSTKGFAYADEMSESQIINVHAKKIHQVTKGRKPARESCFLSKSMLTKTLCPTYFPPIDP